jgi:hypothetical protein
MNAGQANVSKLDISAPDAASFQRLVSIPLPSSPEAADVVVHPPRPPPPKQVGGTHRPPPPSSKPPSKAGSRRTSADDMPSTGFVMPQLKPVVKTEPTPKTQVSANARTALQPPGKRTELKSGPTKSASASATSQASKQSSSTTAAAGKPALPTKPSMLKPVLAKKPPPPVKPDLTLRNARAGLKPAGGDTPRLGTKPSLPTKPQLPGKPKAGGSSKMSALQAKFAGEQAPKAESSKRESAT